MKIFVYVFMIVFGFFLSIPVVASNPVSMRDFYFGDIKRTPSGNYGVDISNPDEKFTV